VSTTLGGNDLDNSQPNKHATHVLHSSKKSHTEKRDHQQEDFVRSSLISARKLRIHHEDGELHKASNQNTRLVQTTEKRTEVEGALLLDVVVGKGAPILELLPCENETLLVRRNALLVLDLGLDIVNSIRRLDFEGDGLPRQGLDKNLHAATETED
jgi:hypothetical protein